MRLPHIAARMFNTPLLVLPEYAAVMATALADRLGIEPMIGSDVVERYKRPNERSIIDKRAGIAILPIVGGTVHRGDGPEAASGVQSYTSIQNHVTELLDDRTVRGILLDIDSGGGEAAGIHELAAFLAEANKEKPIWAIANTTAASAAYWTLASADRAYVAPGGRVGSIGVYVQHVDMSKMMEKRGIVASFIFAGKHKVDGNPFEALPDDVRASIQESVNSLWSEFAGYVAERREMTTEQVQGFEAKVFGPAQAVEAGLVDGIATLGEVLSDFGAYLNKPYFSGHSTGDNMSTERLSHSATDVANAREEGRVAGIAEGKTIAKTEITKIHSDLGAALATMFPDSKRAQTFLETLSDGVSIGVATKTAMRIEDAAPAPTAPARSATAAHVDAIMTAQAPNISAGNQANLDPRAARLAELATAGKAHAVAKGYRAA